MSMATKLRSAATRPAAIRLAASVALVSGVTHILDVALISIHGLNLTIYLAAAIGAIAMSMVEQVAMPMSASVATIAITAL